MYTYYLFDLDGTLTDPGEGITNAAAYALEHFGIHVEDRRQLYPFIGPPLMDAFQHFYGFSEREAEEAVRTYRVYYREKGVHQNLLYPGITEVLKTLHAQEKILAVATSKPEPFARQILEYFGLAKYFTFIGGATFDPSRSRKADVIRYVLERLRIEDKSRVLMIGDRSHDVIGARVNDLDAMGVLYGYGSYEEFIDAGADYIAKMPEDILTPVYRLRPHHGMCLAFFEGKGYSTGFTAHMGKMLDLFESQDPLLELVRLTDSICIACPNNLKEAEGYDRCSSSEKVIPYDQAVLRKTGLSEHDRLTYSRFKEIVYDKVLKTGMRKEICGDCQWDGICSRKEKEMFCDV